MEADCDTPQKFSCPCCSTCHGIFASGNDEVACSSTEVMFQFTGNSPGAIFEFGLYDSGGLVFTQTHSLGNEIGNSYTHTTCVSVTGCFYFYVYPYESILDLEIFTSNSIILKDTIHGEGYHDFHNYNFGFGAEDRDFHVDTCDNYLLCDHVIQADSAKRVLVDKLIRDVGIEGFDDTLSSEFKAVCQWVAFLEGLSEEELTQTGLVQGYYLSYLYYETGGDQWVNSSGWATNSSFCSWHGVICNQDKVVTSITLSSNKLSGNIPTQISKLVGLENLQLGNNNLVNAIPREIGILMKDLKRFNVSKNTLGGSIPSEFGLLGSLEVFDASHNEIAGSLPTEVGNIQRIRVLNLFDNTFSGEIPTSFNKLTLLQVLNLGRNLFAGDVNVARDMFHLESLNLMDNSFTGSVPIDARQGQLRSVLLSGNLFRGSIPTSIEFLTSLEELYLYNNELTGGIPSQFGSLQKLRETSISYNNIAGTLPLEIGRLTQLTLLHLHHNELEGDGDLFNETIQNYILDCGRTSTTEAKIECSSCSTCCNEDGDCITTNETWPGEVIQELDMEAESIVFVTIFAGCVGFAVIMYLSRFFFDVNPDHVFFQNFQSGSVYKFFLSDSIAAMIVALVPVPIQLILLSIFLGPSDFTLSRTDWQYYMDCPSNSTVCENRKYITLQAWIAFGCTLFFYLSKDTLESCKIIFKSVHMKCWEGGVIGVIVMYVTLCSVIISVLYSSSTSISSTEIMKDAIVLLFLTDIDERFYDFLLILCPSWVNTLNEKIATRFRGRTTANNERPSDSNVGANPEKFFATVIDEETTEQEQETVKEKEFRELKSGFSRLENEVGQLKRDNQILLSEKREAKRESMEAKEELQEVKHVRRGFCKSCPPLHVFLEGDSLEVGMRFRQLLAHLILPVFW